MVVCARLIINEWVSHVATVRSSLGKSGSCGVLLRILPLSGRAMYSKSTEAPTV